MKKFLLFGLIAAVLPAFAEEVADRKTATSLKYVTHELDTRQNKFGADTNKAMEYTNSAGTVQKRAVTSELGSSTSDTSLPMVGGVNTKLDLKQDDIDPVNDHTAVTYTGTAGGIGRKGIYQTTGTYTDQSDNLIDAKTFNAALKKGLDIEFKCKETKPGTDLCWVYSIHNETEEKTKNLLNPSFMDNSTYETVTVNGVTIDRAKILPTENGKTYTLSATLIANDGGTYFYYLAEIFPDGTYSSQSQLPCHYMWTNYTSANTNTTVEKTCTFTTHDNATYLVNFANSSSVDYLTLTNYQMEEGATATPYVPYGNVYIPQNQ